MSGRPWGTTGRVTVQDFDDDPPEPGATANVILDGKCVGWIGYPDDDPWWAEAYVVRDPLNVNLPTLDAAVMWVLRRAATDVWRQERGPIRNVWRSRVLFPGKWSTEWPGGLVLVSDTHAEALAAATGPTP